MRFTAVVLACASTALAYTVTEPSQNKGWTNQGPQLFKWTRVTSDRENFTAVLVNNNKTLLASPQVLAALVNGSLGETTLNPPSAGWPTPGEGYQINVVAEATNIDAILAQSTPFEIKEGPPLPSSAIKTTAGSSQTGASGATPTDTTQGSGALSNFGIPVGVAALAALVSVSLA